MEWNGMEMKRISRHHTSVLRKAVPSDIRRFLLGSDDIRRVNQNEAEFPL